MNHYTNRQGMTLVETLLMATIITVLAAFIIPVINVAIRSRENAECARKLRTAVLAFESYAAEIRSYPADTTPGVIPPEMANYYFPYYKIDWWGDPAELGGQWDWDNGYHFALSVSIAEPTKPSAQMIEFDRLIDDGNLSSGNFRQVGTQYHYIIQQ
ncbi:MAG: type II secretion system protein [Kiritimatiellaceae bacterium]|nr:type II secretion system protein [Kiritimatiellaceae bacterium]